MSLWDRLKDMLPSGNTAPPARLPGARVTPRSTSQTAPSPTRNAASADSPLVASLEIVWGPTLQESRFPSRLSTDPRYSYFTRQDEMAIKAAVSSAHLSQYHDAYFIFYPTTTVEEMMGGESQTPSVMIDLNHPGKGTIDSRMGNVQTLAPRQLKLRLLTHLPDFSRASLPERTYKDGFANGFNIAGLPSDEFKHITDALQYFKTIPHSHSVVYLVGRSTQPEGAIAFYWSNYRNLREAYRRYNAPADTSAKQQKSR